MNRDNFIVRPVQKRDLSDLFELSQKVYLINLPRDEKLIAEKIERSINSFQGAYKNRKDDLYVFCLCDQSKGKVIGTAMIHGKHGDDDTPHFSLVVGKEEKFSSTINTGFTHGTLKLKLDFDGPTEIGGLVLSPDYRGNKLKLGKFLSFSRFLLVAEQPERFEETLHCELMPPLDNENKSALWESLGKKFMNMDYLEADRLSRKNKEFILSLFPQQNIYQTLLPLNARNAIGQVGKSTLPVKKMIEDIGFSYISEVDPFDGGPHYQAPKKEILPIKNFYTGDIREISNEAEFPLNPWIVKPIGTDGNNEMRLLDCIYEKGVLLTSPESLKKLSKTRVSAIPLNY